MDTKNPVTGNLPNDQPSDLSFQIMPTDNGPAEIRAPMPPPPGHELPRSNNRLIYIIIGVIVLIILGALAYFMLGSKKTTQPVQETATTKLPKVWLQQYFNKEVCDEQNVCGDDVDPDNDGLKNYDEFKTGTSPINPDMDGDGMADGDELNIYKTEATLKYTDRRDIVAQNDWTDGVQIKNNYDPLTPGLKFTDFRKQQITDDTTKFSLHEPTITTLAASSNQTADWKTYADTKYTFEVSYPPDWLAKTNVNGSSITPSVVTFLSPQSQKNTSTSYQKDRIDLYVYDSIADLNKVYKVESTDLSDFFSKKISDVAIYTKSTFNGMSAFDVKLGGEGTYFAIFFEKDSKIYEIFFNVIGTRQDISTLENQILSTFKFTK